MSIAFVAGVNAVLAVAVAIANWVAGPWLELDEELLAAAPCA